MPVYVYDLIKPFDSDSDSVESRKKSVRWGFE